MIRVLDSLGRIVIPTEIRMTRNIDIGDPLEFFITSDNTIVMRKYKSTECVFCRELNSITYYKQQFVCQSCISELKDVPESLPLHPFSGEVQAENDPVYELKEPAATLSPKKRSKKSESLLRLSQALQGNPEATQKQLAELLGISQGRVSQLKKEILMLEASSDQ
nr:AbrB/MazE/SpoVT family DNA-binding domain-containing protein [Paenibacillus sp. J2TS4]